MQIYKKEPVIVLYEALKSIKNTVPIFKEVMYMDKNDIPASYILIRSQVTDTTSVFGDGKSLVRTADCDIILISKGYADKTTDAHNINKTLIRNKLKEALLPYTEYNNGYDAATGNTEHIFSVNVVYYG